MARPYPNVHFARLLADGFSEAICDTARDEDFLSVVVDDVGCEACRKLLIASRLPGTQRGACDICGETMMFSHLTLEEGIRNHKLGKH